MKLCQTFKVEWFDTDALGIVHYTNYLKYVEKAEHTLLDEIGLDFNHLHEDLHVGIPRVEIRCKYVYPIKYRQDVEVQLWITRLAEKSFKYTFKIYNKSENKVAAKGWMTVVAVDLRKFTATAIPAVLRRGLESFQYQRGRRENRISILPQRDSVRSAVDQTTRRAP